jgi:hypothetical protein
MGGELKGWIAPGIDQVTPNVGVGSKAEIDGRPSHVCTTPESGRSISLIVPTTASRQKRSSIAGSSVKGQAILGLLVRSPHLERYARLTLPAAKLTCLRRRAEQALSNRSSPRDRDASERLPCLAPRSAGARCIDQAQIRAPPGKNDLDRRQANEP